MTAIELVGYALRLPLLLVEGWLALVSAYLVLLAAASFRFRERQGVADATLRRFAVLIPAYNEEAVIGRLIESLKAMDYRRERYVVSVVADNCTDATAAVVRDHGVNVYERTDLSARGKGHALRWLMQQIPLAEFDAVVIVDADSVVSPNLLSVANAAFADGCELGQVYDGVLNRGTSSAAGLRALAFDLHNYVRPLGMEALGVSVGLMGNGMILSPRALGEVAWDSYGLAEDMEAHAKLLRSGRRVRFLPEASVLAEMPDTLADSAGQNVRWEAGRLDVARRYGLSLLSDGVRLRRRTLAAAGLETLIPPQSVQLTLGLASFGGAILLGWTAGIALGAAIIAAQTLYISLSLLRLRRRGLSLGCLVQAPGYVLWKTLLYARVLTGQGSRRWVRGSRAGSDEVAA